MDSGGVMGHQAVAGCWDFPLTYRGRATTRETAFNVLRGRGVVPLNANCIDTGLTGTPVPAGFLFVGRILMARSCHTGALLFTKAHRSSCPVDGH